MLIPPFERRALKRGKIRLSWKLVEFRHIAIGSFGSRAKALCWKTKSPPSNEDGRPAVPPRLAQRAHLPECACAVLPSAGHIQIRDIGRTRLRLLSDAIAVRATAQEGSLVGRIRSGSQHPGFAGR